MLKHIDFIRIDYAFDLSGDNECISGVANCEQGCHNQADGYTCLCHQGYTVQTDGQCEGEQKKKKSSLLTKWEIYYWLPGSALN